MNRLEYLKKSWQNIQDSKNVHKSYSRVTFLCGKLIFAKGDKTSVNWNKVTCKKCLEFRAKYGT